MTKEKNIEREIQLKILSRSKLLKRIEDLQFSSANISLLEDYYFSEDGKFASNQAYFRVRKKNDDLELTYKKNIGSGETKIRKEIILKVDSVENSLEFLREIGLKEVVAKKMSVTTYKQGETLIEIIKTTEPSRFEFVEIESPDQTHIDMILARLGDSVSVLREEDFPKI